MGCGPAVKYTWASLVSDTAVRGAAAVLAE